MAYCALSKHQYFDNIALWHSQSRGGGAVVDAEYGISRPSSGRVRQSPIDNIRHDIAARIIEESLSPTPAQNVDRTSR